MCELGAYLVTVISNDGQFKLSINELCNRASRAM